MLNGLQMVELCSKLEKDVADIDSVNSGLETRGAGLISRASELHARLESASARALEQVNYSAFCCCCPFNHGVCS